MRVVRTGSMITVPMGTELSKVSIGRDTVIAIGVPVAVAVGVGDAVAVAVAVGVGDGGTPIMVMRPLGRLGVCVSRLSSMKINPSGAGFQTSEVIAPGVLLTLSILRLKSVPIPFSGVKSFEKADRRRVLIVPGPVLRTLADTVQLTAVSPAGSTYGLWNVTTAESKVKSPWKAT